MTAGFGSDLVDFLVWGVLAYSMAFAAAWVEMLAEICGYAWCAR
jgi:hypothetical protein